ncbi:MAG: CPBP family intramembrane glutamic endopeptidase [Actinomycetes bacterium]
MDSSSGFRAGLARARGIALTQLPTVNRRLLKAEIFVVLGLSLGMSALYAYVDIVADLTRHVALNHQATGALVGSHSSRPWVDLAYQILDVISGVMPAALVVYLLFRSGESNRTIGLDGRQPRFDISSGALLAAVIGGAGLALYLIAHALGIALTVVVSNLAPVWWRDPILVLSAAQNAILEEVVVAAYLLHRLRQLGWSNNKALALSAGLRGSYHLYQGFGGFLGNAVLGVVFGWLYQRWGRVMPLIIAHTLIDAVAFVGYVELVGHVSWLPT